jgi:hypothetical protein
LEETVPRQRCSRRHPARLSRAERHPIGTYWLAGRAGAVPTGGVTRFAASLLPVPLGAAELLITPLLPELIVSLLVLSTRLQPLAPTVSAAIDAAINVLLRIEFMTTALPSNLFYAASRHARTSARSAALAMPASLAKQARSRVEDEKTMIVSR